MLVYSKGTIFATGFTTALAVLCYGERMKFHFCIESHMLEHVKQLDLLLSNILNIFL